MEALPHFKFPVSDHIHCLLCFCFVLFFVLFLFSCLILFLVLLCFVCSDSFEKTEKKRREEKEKFGSRYFVISSPNRFAMYHCCIAIQAVSRFIRVQKKLIETWKCLISVSYLSRSSLRKRSQ